MARLCVQPYDGAMKPYFMQHLRPLFVCALALLGIASSVGTADAQSQAQTVATIRQLETGWSDAEATGNSAFLEKLLMPDYRSVNVTGKVHYKADIIAGALKPKTAAMRQMMETYTATHHVVVDVDVHGTMAIVTFHSQSLGEKGGISSCDIFVNVDGQWHAVYSQHTNFRM